MNFRQPPSLHLAPMTTSDIEAVVALEVAAYGSKYPRKDYVYELEKNQNAYHFTVRLSPQDDLIGQAGFWLLADEIHISTIAVHPTWQQAGLGAWLLLNLLEKGQALGGTLATLEVRISNQAALALYRHFHFQEVGRRRNYYRNGEDALILTTPALASDEYQTLLQQQKMRISQRLGLRIK